LHGGLAMAYLFDLTERRQAERERERLRSQFLQAQKMESVGRLAGGVAHDFNNMLTVINGYCRLLLDGKSSGELSRRHLEEIKRAGEHAEGITKQLLAFSRKQLLQPCVVDCNRTVQDIQPMLAPLVGEDIELCVKLHEAATTVYADPHQLEQVILNLAVNARDAMPLGGKLQIETAIVESDENPTRLPSKTQAGSYVMLAMSDNGIGMDEETRRHIFEPFFTTKPVGKGSGLGLSMIDGIVEQSGGYIEVESEPGQGATFRIFLPYVADAPRGSSEPEARSVPETNGVGTVLVVEDQAEVREYASEALRAYGYRVIQAENAIDALLLYEADREAIDLVLTDVVMPNLSGRELADLLATKRPSIKVLFMSGYTDDDAILHRGALRKGTDFIQKPFSPDQLAAKVRVMLNAPHRASRVLVADDEAGVRAFLRLVLEGGGYDVIEAANGKEAIQHVRAENVDLLITDLVMPVQEGIETIIALRKERPGMQIIAISGAFGGKFLSVARLLGVGVVLNKPLNADLLLAKVAELLPRP
jgi:two-component system, cell cycle sensor histidine kinase and response regulator CckA